MHEIITLFLEKKHNKTNRIHKNPEIKSTLRIYTKGLDPNGLTTAKIFE